MSAQFLVGVYVPTEPLAETLHQLLAQQSFVVSWSQSESAFTQWVVSNRHRVDCLIVQSSEESLRTLEVLRSRDILLPALLVRQATTPPPLSEAGLTVFSGSDGKLNLDGLGDRQSRNGSSAGSANGSEASSRKIDGSGLWFDSAYHDAVTDIDVSDIDGLEDAIRQAVNRYLQLPTEIREYEARQTGDTDKRLFLLSVQQQRLREKLKERLGYAGVYYKRNRQNFLQNMDPSEKQELLYKLHQDYRRLILNYFSDDSEINQKIDDFVNVAFFADVSVPNIVELHMELIEDFSKQLKLEGRNEEVLVDYRLTLIDVIAHLCEMYRRSIPQDL